MDTGNKYLIPSIILGLSFLFGLFLLSKNIYKSRAQQRYVSVKGLAEKNVTADKGSWMISSEYHLNTIPELKVAISNHEKVVKNFLREKGFTDQEIKTEEIGINRNWYQDAAAKHTATIRIEVNSSNVNLLEKTSQQVSELIDKGILITGDRWLSRPKYYFTRINEIKPELLKEATQAARVSAQEFANNSGSAVGEIKRANQGIISILPANRSSDGQEFFKEKMVRVVSSIDYFLK